MTDLDKRLAHVDALLRGAIKRRDRMKPGGPRDRASRWAGSLTFARLTILREIETLTDSPTDSART